MRTAALISEINILSVVKILRRPPYTFSGRQMLYQSKFIFFLFKDQALSLCFDPNFSPRPSVFLLWNSLNDINSCFRHLDDTMDSLQWMCSFERQLPYRTIEPAFALCICVCSFPFHVHIPMQTITFMELLEDLNTIIQQRKY